MKPRWSCSSCSAQSAVTAKSCYYCSSTQSNYAKPAPESRLTVAELRKHTIRVGLKRSNPAAIVLWAFHKISSRGGLTSRRVIGFLKKHYKVLDDPYKTGKSIGSLIRCAVDFGLLEKRGNKFFLANKKR